MPNHLPGRKVTTRVPSRHAIPVSHEPYWFRGGHPLAGYQSDARLPETAAVVVIGAGLTGASAAYHLAQAPSRPGRIVVVDQGNPAGEASGRNGGSFELIPENSVGVYEGLAQARLAFLRRLYHELPVEVLRAESERQASVVLGLALRNRDLLKAIILRERIDCDFSPRGWLHLASSERGEQGLCEEVMLAAQHGQRIELWSRRKIRTEMGIDHNYLGRFVPTDGTYHPFKYVCGLLTRALASGAELYTGVRVREVISEHPDHHRVVTARGTITTPRVIVATNAFTAALFPELRLIRPRQSQIQLTEHARDRTRGRVVTCDTGPVFFNQPRGGARNGYAPLLLGGGADRPMQNPSSRRRSPQVHRLLLSLRDRFYPELRGSPPAAEWVGAMAFTPDQLPAIGFLRPGLVIAAGYNGYGGSYTTAAGCAAAAMALTSQAPAWVPDDIFSPRRLMTSEPLFMGRRDSVWRLGTLLCRQLRCVNQQISDALTLATDSTGTAPVRRPRAMTPVTGRQIGAVQSQALAAFPLFAAFSLAELSTLLRAARQWTLSPGTVLFTQGSPGGTCFAIVDGAVDVSVQVNGQHQRLAHLPPGSVFGQVSVFDGEPRSATCTSSRQAVLVEWDREACARLLSRRSPLALKLLAVLNTGLISALRRADRQLMRLENGEVDDMRLTRTDAV
jgi:glycine/D-amino acid oxidase-like deaminating enzyme/CRP-like cAMP-binding protein